MPVSLGEPGPVTLRPEADSTYHFGRTRSPTVAPGAAKHWPQLGLDDAADFTTTEAIAAITRGNFRLTRRLATQIERIVGYARTRPGEDIKPQHTALRARQHTIAKLYCVSRGTIYRNIIRRTPKTGEKSAP
jgi:hypothetical protein